MKKRVLYILICFLILQIICPNTTLYANQENFAGGNGTADDPYQVSTPEQLDDVRNYLNAHFIQINDIDLSDWGNWEPIGYSDWSVYPHQEEPFAGVYDGGGYIIKGLSLGNYDMSFIGLFGSNSGVIKNLGTIDSYISGSSAVGTIAGLNFEGTIKNCYNTGFVFSNGVDDIYSGGIVGMNAGLVSGCYNTGWIISLGQAGGIAGHNSGAGDSAIINCYNTGVVWAFIAAGGISGDHHGAEIKNCYNAGYVSLNFGSGGSGAGAGGIIGGSIDAPSFIVNGAIENCYIMDGGYYDNDYGTVLTDVQIKMQSSFENWDFDDVWKIDEEISYPYLRAFKPPTETPMSIENLEMLYPFSPLGNTIIITLSRPLFGEKLLLSAYDDGVMVELTDPTIFDPVLNQYAVPYWGEIPPSVIIKVFVWDNFNNMRPSCPVRIMKYENGDWTMAY